MQLQQQNQLALNQDSYNKQVDFWNMQNEYNTPANQRKLAEEAGYNILDVLRNGGSISTAGQLSPVASGSAGLGSVGMPSSANYSEGFASVAAGLGSLAQAGLAKMKTKTESFTQDLLSQQTTLTSEQVVGQQTANAVAEINRYIAENTKETDIATRVQNLRNIEATFESIVAQTAVKMNEFGRESLIRQELASQIGVLQGNIALQKWQTEAIKVGIRVSEAEIQAIYAQASELYSRRDLNLAHEQTERWKLNEGYYESEKLVNRAQERKIQRERKWMPVMNISKIINDRTEDFKNLGAGLMFSSNALNSFSQCLERVLFMRYGRKGVKTFEKANRHGEFTGGTTETWHEALGR